MVGEPGFGREASETGISLGDPLEDEPHAHPPPVGRESAAGRLAERSSEVVRRAVQSTCDRREAESHVLGEGLTRALREAVTARQAPSLLLGTCIIERRRRDFECRLLEVATVGARPSTCEKSPRQKVHARVRGERPWGKLDVGERRSERHGHAPVAAGDRMRELLLIPGSLEVRDIALENVPAAADAPAERPASHDDQCIARGRLDQSRLALVVRAPYL